MSEAGASAVSAATAIAEAIKASGAIVRVEPGEFVKLLGRQDEPLVVAAVGGFLSTSYQYLVSYKGLTFYTKSPEQLALPPRSEVVTARSIYIPA